MNDLAYFDFSEYLQRFKFIRNLKHITLGETQLVKEKKSNLNYIVKEKDFYKFVEFNDFLMNMRDFLLYNKCLNMIEFRYYTYKIVKENIQWRILCFYEYMELDLEKTIVQKQRNNELFNEEIIWKILKDIVSSIIFLERNNVFNFDIRPINIYISKDETYKIMYTPFNIQPLQQIQRGSSYFKFYLSPEILLLMRDGKDLNINNTKSNIFCLGILILMISSFNATYESIYDIEKNIINQNNIQIRFNFIKDKYSEGLKFMLEKILDFNPENRPCYEEIILFIETFHFKNSKFSYKKYNLTSEKSLKLSNISLDSSLEFSKPELLNNIITSKNEISQIINENNSLKQIDDKICELKSTYQSRITQIKDKKQKQLLSPENYEALSTKDSLISNYNSINHKDKITSIKPTENQFNYISDNEYNSEKKINIPNLSRPSMDARIDVLKNTIFYNNDGKIRNEIKQILYEDGSKYLGTLKSDLRDGKGVYYYSNGDVYFGDWSKNIINGIGVYFFSNGELYEGHFLNSKRQGSGIYHYLNNDIYKGEWQSDMKSGFGKLEYQSKNEIYEGEWKNDQKNGEGIYTFSNGDKFIGFWQNGEKFGKGEILFKNGAFFEGEWNLNYANGFGILKYKNGDLFEGNYVDGIKQGGGIYKHESGDKYAGEWFMDERTGKGVYYYNNGDKYVGEINEGTRTGFGEYFYQNGDKYNGMWCKDKKQGKGKFCFANGGEFYGEWTDNFIEGFGKMIYRNGDNYEGNWRKGEKWGLGKYCWNDGTFFEGEWIADKIAKL